jgi:hypothetical protein
MMTSFRVARARLYEISGVGLARAKTRGLGAIAGGTVRKRKKPQKNLQIFKEALKIRALRPPEMKTKKNPIATKCKIIHFNISGFKSPAAETPRKTSAPSMASVRVLFVVVEATSAK